MESRTTLKMLAIAVAICLSIGTTAWGQNPTGTLTGRVTNNQDGTPLPGVTVTATSPNLQGQRTTITGANGDYKIPLLPAGPYTVKYELEGMAVRDVETKVSAAQSTLIDVGMAVAALAEEILVTAADAATISETSTAAATFVGTEIDKLAIGRDVINTVSLAAGTSQTGPAGNTTISGAMSFENLWLVNGVVVNENLRGQPLNLFIEDAIEETTVATGGVSAEYGRFTGGVVNVLTKSGGNEFHGSLRASATNQDWVSSGREKVFNDEFEPEDEINETYEGTLGGRIWTDRIWFFIAARDLETATTTQTDITGIPFDQGREQERYEGKLTVNLLASHTLVGSYLEIDDLQSNGFFTSLDPLDLNVLSDREDPQDLTAINYNGVITSNFFLEGQYSERNFDIAKGSGGPRDLYAGSTFEALPDSSFWHAPFFCGGCEQEVRNNENFLAKGSYFLSTDSGGTHDLAFGYDTYDDIRFSVNHQTGSDLRLIADDYFFGPDKEVFPILTDAAWVTAWPVFGLDRAAATDFTTNSYYINDRWQLNDKWSFNLGVRYDENDGVDAGGNKTVDDSKTSPRLAVTYDLKGDGDFVFNASYGTYVAAVANNRANATATGGAIGRSILFYGGPFVNPNGAACLATNSCVSSDEAVHIMVDWYIATYGFNPLTDPPEEIAGLPDPLGALTLPAAQTNQIVPDTLQSPSADDYTIGVTKRLGVKGLFRADLIYRDWDDFYSDRVRPNNTINIAGNVLDIKEVGNYGNSALSREYTGLQTQFRYRATNRLTTAATYTLSELEGNIDGETSGSGPITNDPFDKPEYKDFSWNIPEGNLGADQRHKFRGWAIYDILQGEHNHLSASLLQSFFSGTPYGAAGRVDSRAGVTNPGYRTPPASVTYYFTDRDAFTTDDIWRTDLALNYSFSWNIGGKSYEVFVAPEVINVFDEDGQVFVNTGVFDRVSNSRCAGSSTGACLGFNPFTTTPVQGVNWDKGPSFGKATSAADYQTARTFRIGVGFRF